MTNQSAYREYQQIIRLSLNNSTSTALSSQSTSNDLSSSQQLSPQSTNKKFNINKSKLNYKPESPSSSSSYSAPLSPESCCASDSDSNSNNNELSGFSNTTTTTTDELENNKQQLKPKITRTKTGCFCCRKRKKKCDELKPICSGCARNHLTCVYPTEESLKKKSTNSNKKSSKITKSTKKTTTSNIKEKKTFITASIKNESNNSSSSAPAFSKFSALLAIAANESAAVEKEEVSKFTSMPNSPVSQACSPKAFKFSNNFSTSTNNNNNINNPNFTSPPQSPPEYISPLSSPNLTPVSFTLTQSIPHRSLSNDDQTHSVSHNYPKSISINSLLN
ncbi:hypothetical protein B5S31_g4452 [[Candida] boidinii]|nr:hypothetical protein B5S31_g4452 [[Candida] boidinii]